MLRKFVSQVPNVTLKNDQITDDARTPCSHAEARTVQQLDNFEEDWLNDEEAADYRRLRVSDGTPWPEGSLHLDGPADDTQLSSSLTSTITIVHNFPALVQMLPKILKWMSGRYNLRIVTLTLQTTIYLLMYGCCFFYYRR